MNVQTRSEETGIRYFQSVKEAFMHASTDATVWKISFTSETKEQVRLVRNSESNQWNYEPIYHPWDVIKNQKTV